MQHKPNTQCHSQTLLFLLKYITLFKMPCNTNQTLIFTLKNIQTLADIPSIISHGTVWQFFRNKLTVAQNAWSVHCQSMCVCLFDGILNNVMIWVSRMVCLFHGILNNVMIWVSRTVCLFHGILNNVMIWVSRMVCLFHGILNNVMIWVSRMVWDSKIDCARWCVW